MKKLLLASLIAAIAAPSFGSELFFGGQLARTSGDYNYGFWSGLSDDSTQTQLRFGSYLSPEHRVMATMEWSGDSTDEFGLIAHYDYMMPMNADWTANIGVHMGTRFIEWFDGVDKYDFSTLQYGLQFGATYHIAPELDFGINMRLSGYNGSQTKSGWLFEKDNDATFGFSFDYRF